MICVLAHAQQPIQQTFDAGLAAFKAAHYREAVTAFQSVLEQEPGNLEALRHLGTSYMVPWIPGDAKPDNLELAANARRAFLQAHKIEPTGKAAMESLASIAFNMAKAADGDGIARLERIDFPSLAQKTVGAGQLQFPIDRSAVVALGVHKKSDVGVLPEDLGHGTRHGDRVGVVVLGFKGMMADRGDGS